jgi:glutamine---fructose-6-phosphate transaminase (isomerizing)
VQERSVVMTQSFTSMLLALQASAATIAGDEATLEQLRRLPPAARELMDAAEDFARRLGEDLDLSEFVYLGLGPAFGLAEEAMLKMTEMTQTHCVAYNSLEFRHGPISTVRPGTAVVLLNGLRERDYVDALVRDLGRHGAFVATISAEANRGSDLDLALGTELGDPARSVLHMPALQLMAYYRATALGLDPDAPRNLDHVVVLDGGE